ncbi:MAG: DUF98 domain-containing protein [Acidimicrobiia bacterium]|nr:DUF98 domain-containing protein [Acidimicrobiia bacterium]
MLEDRQLLGGWGPGLSAVQRILLTTDGRITDTIEAYAREPVCVVKLSETLDEPGYLPNLKLSDDDDVLYRSVMIQGTETKKDYLYATSLIVAGRLPTAMLESLLYTDAPFGRLLVEHQVETLREILFWSREAAGRYSEYFDMKPTDMLLSRTYRVISDHRPVALITEKFPEGNFREE